MKYASIVRRVIAYLIDSVLVFVVFIMLTQTFFFGPVRPLVIGSENWFRSGWNTELYTLLTISFPTWLYFSLFEFSSWQATPGKRLLKLKTLDQLGGNRLTLFQAVIRTLVKLAPWEIAHLTNNLPVPMWYDPTPGFRIGFIVVPVLILFYVGLAFATQNKQSLHDLIAKTVVISNG